ncbi:MAG: glycosyltransferase family 39 protein [Rhodocyclaceae bacterium]|nr:glycosyltransferase family 39 protein [Rhodocyclaceae bacterium]
MQRLLLSSGRLFLVIAGLTLAFRFWLAAVFPISGDEAYFIGWGKVPDWGFYDHPPMIGWWLAGLLSVSDAEWWLRLPQIVQPVLLALAVRWAWPRLWPQQTEARDWVALLVLLAPVNVWNVLVTTDTALVYFAVLSGLAWLRATQDNDLRWYAVVGIFLAGAVLSKYFAALLGFAYLVDVLRRRSCRAFAGLAIAYACTVPALLLMAWWNSGHCWTNYMFNFVNRHGSGNTGLDWKHPLLYAAALAYVLTPPVLWVLFKRRSSRRLTSADFSIDRSLLVLTAVPLLLFALLSLAKTIGLHWVLSFVPFALMLAARRLTMVALQKLVLFFLGFAVLHIAAIFTISRLPLETWRASGFYSSGVLTFASQALVERAAPGDSLLVSDGYSNAVILGYNLRRHVPVLGMASSHARHDDILTDWRAHDGHAITVLRKTEPQPAEYDRWFASVITESFEYRGARFWVVRGHGFDYTAYRETVLAEVRRRYYVLPPWLPQRGCYFCDRYFPEEPCRR